MNSNVFVLPLTLYVSQFKNKDLTGGHKTSIHDFSYNPDSLKVVTLRELKQNKT